MRKEAWLKVLAAGMRQGECECVIGHAYAVDSAGGDRLSKRFLEYTFRRHGSRCGRLIKVMLSTRVADRVPRERWGDCYWILSTCAGLVVVERFALGVFLKGLQCRIIYAICKILVTLRRYGRL